MLEQLICELFKTQMIKFGEFTLKSGKTSYIYADIRSAIGVPAIFNLIVDEYCKILDNLKFDSICGVPYSALTFAAAIAYKQSCPQLLKRKEAKSYGTKQLLEGFTRAHSQTLIIEDVITTGMSIMETIDALSAAEITCKDIVVLIDREQGGNANLTNKGYKVHSLMTLTHIIEVLHKFNFINSQEKQLALSSIY